jgi:hypothetical protein
MIKFHIAAIASDVDIPLYYILLVTLQVLKVASMKMTALWEKALCSLVEVYRCFRGT